MSKSSWFKFDNSWPFEVVELLLTELSLDKTNSTIIDPFMGPGATLYKARAMGFNCIGLDISPFSYLSSYYNLIPPSLKDIKSIQKKVGDAKSVEDLLCQLKLSNDEIENYLSFLISYSIYQLGCKNYQDLKKVEFKHIFENLADFKRLQEYLNSKDNITLMCGDFFEFSNTLDNSIAFVSSPPFFNSEENESKLFVDSLIKNNIGIENNLEPNFEKDKMLLKVICQIERLPNEKIDEIAKYLQFLARILLEIQKHNFSKVGLEVGSLYTGYGKINFHLYWQIKLEQLNYTVTILYDVDPSYRGINLLIATKINRGDS